MACSSSSGCESGCGKTVAMSDAETQPSQNSSSVCVKCKENYVISAGAAGEDGRYCPDCFRANLFGKFRFAVTSNAMISPNDKILVAYSGGPSSRVLLQFVHDMQQKAQANFEASPDRSLPVFGVGVAFVDERCVLPGSSGELEKAIKDMESLVLKLSPPSKKFDVVPIENIYQSESNDNGKRLKELVQGVTDVTGKEDLLLHLRRMSLQKIAREEGYTKIILGSCTSKIACDVLTSTVKGQGYSLAADIQYVDSRQRIPVVLPLRDCRAQEISILCHLDGLKTSELQTGHSPSINTLVSSFVKLLQEENPSRESTIMRTASKLIPFHFNRIPENSDAEIHLASRLRKKFNANLNQSIMTESFCPVCVSPVKDSDMKRQSYASESQRTIDSFATSCCSSCRFQILPSDFLSLEQFHMHLPQLITDRAKDDDQSQLREQIEEFLLSENGE